jgi:hypothetical protein
VRAAAGDRFHMVGAQTGEQTVGCAGQLLARIARLFWPDPRVYLRDPEGFRQMLRPACHLPPHRTVCRRHRLWIGPAARAHAGQLDVSQQPEILRAQRRHLALVRHHQWWQVDTAVSGATRAIHQALRAGAWTLPQRRRLRQLAPAPCIRPCPVCSASARAGQTTAPALLPSRSRSTPTSSSSPHTTSELENQARSRDLAPWRNGS